MAELIEADPDFISVRLIMAGRLDGDPPRPAEVDWDHVAEWLHAAGAFAPRRA